MRTVGKTGLEKRVSLIWHLVNKTERDREQRQSTVSKPSSSYPVKRTSESKNSGRRYPAVSNIRLMIADIRCQPSVSSRSCLRPALVSE